MMEKFLRYEMDKYLNTRRFESKGEKPLEDVEFQSYVYYQKGGIAMYALRDYIGEDTLNKALKSYIRDYAFTGPPYTNTRDFLRYIRKATPDSLQYFITDEFEKITFYENSTSQASYVKLPDGRYRVKMDIHLNKSYSDKLGNEVPTPVNDYIEVGVYGASKVKNKPNFIYLQKMKLNDKMKSIEFIVNSLPEKAGIDPRHLLIDKYLQDNTVTVVEEGKTIAKK